MCVASRQRLRFGPWMWTCLSAAPHPKCSSDEQGQEPTKEMAAIRLLLVAMLVCLVMTRTALADDDLSYIRDAEIESTLRTFYNPIFKAAGLDPNAVHVYIINDPELNSFVAGGQNVFINTGTIMRSESPNQLVGIVAHETGHIADGHLARFDRAMHNASIEGMIAMAVGVGVAILGHGSDAVGAAAAAGQEVGLQSFLHFSVAQEASADRAALRFLDKTHQSARGLLQFFEILEQDERLSGIKEIPYLRTHPLTSERIETIREHVENSPYSNNPDPPEWIELHKRMKAKLIAFLQPPAEVLERFPDSDTSVAARYADAIAYYRIPELKKALNLIDGLIATEPRNPYFEELKGQMLFENGHVQEAVVPYQKAVELAPDVALLRVELAQVELETQDPALTRDALVNLKDADTYENENPDLWRYMTIAYGRLGDKGETALAQAEEALAEGDQPMAKHEAADAVKLLPAGPSRLRAEDIQLEVQEIEKDQ
jgi:predicted Zn-dependent protease